MDSEIYFRFFEIVVIVSASILAGGLISIFCMGVITLKKSTEIRSVLKKPGERR